MYGTTALEDDSIAAGHSFSCYTSRDLENFEGPFLVFDGAWTDFWADRDYWAPEVHEYRGKYYLFGSFKAEDHRRATQILMADHPLGPFAPISEKPQTPEEWECLDGTLWLENGVPYIVFCHEWIQTEIGQICALQLTEDLKEAVGEPFLLFRATDNPETELQVSKYWEHGAITDGPFLYREAGKIKLIWSTFSKGRYAIMEAEADTLGGPWQHKPCRFDFDGGHAMLFRDLAGNPMISFHCPNTTNQERAKFLPFAEL